MADYIVTSEELTSVANAIREKNGTSSSLSWPNGFVSGIGSGGGGGGSSDFSTAEVTFICTDEPGITLPFINIQDDGIYSVVYITQSTQTVTVPLYKNKLSCTIPPFSMSVTSTNGNIAGSQMDGYIISGNCTINYTLPM